MNKQKIKKCNIICIQFVTDLLSLRNVTYKACMCATESSRQLLGYARCIDGPLEFNLHLYSERIDLSAVQYYLI